jgi:hypothetical protein
MLFPKRLFLFSLLLVLVFPLCGLTDKEEIKSFYPCREGSENEFALLGFLTGEFHKQGINFSVLHYDHREGLHSYSRSLKVDFSPENRERTYLAVSLDGDSDFSYLNTYILYKLALELKEESNTKGITLLFLGGERNDIPIGTTVFLEDFTEEETSALIYLDINSSQLNIISSTKGYNAPQWLLKDFVNYMEEEGLSLPQNGIENLFNRSGLGAEDSRLSPWMEREIPSLLLSGSPSPNEEDQFSQEESLIAGLKNFLINESEEIKDNREKNYLVLSLPHSSFMVEEWHSILTIISLLNLFTITVVFQSRNFILNFRKNKNTLWILMLIYSLVFIILYLSTLIMEEILIRNNITDYWLSIPRDILYFKLLLTLLFSSFFLFIIRGIPIPRSPHFYSYGAIFFATINLLVLASQDISMTYYALWLLLCLFPFALTRKMLVKTLLTILTPLPIFYLLTTVLLNRYPDLSHRILMDRIGGNLIIAAFVMPFILMLTSLHYSRFYYHKARRSYTALSVFILVPFMCLYILARIILFDPYSKDQLQPYTVSDIMDYEKETRVVKLNSTLPMGTVEFNYDGRSLILNSLGEQATINGQIDNSYLSYEGTISSFLNRKRLRLNLKPKGRPDSLEIRLYTEEGQITIYDCNFPYTNRSDNRESRIIIGNNPIFPLELDLTVTLETRPSLELVFMYNNPPLKAPEIVNKQVKITHTLTLREVLDLKMEEGDYQFP